MYLVIDILVIPVGLIDYFLTDHNHTIILLTHDVQRKNYVQQVETAKIAFREIK